MDSATEMPRHSLRVLAIVADLPNPPVNGARVRNFHLWPAMRELGHEVKIVGLNAFPTGWRDGAEAAANNDGEFFPRDRPWLPVRALRAVTRSYHERSRSSGLAQRVDELVESWKPDVIHAEELRMAYYLPRMRGRESSALQSVTLHNVESDLYRDLTVSGGTVFARLHSRLQARSLQEYEAKVVAAADLLFAYSPVDYQRYVRAYPSGKWSQTRNGADARHIPAYPSVKEPRVLVVGTLSYVPNENGLFWMLEEVWPRLEKPLSLTVAGSGARPELRERIQRAGAQFIDTPRDLSPLYRESAICAVPVLEGSGTRGKILEACAYQRVVLTTTRGLEGLDLRPGEEGVIVADDAAEFARALDRWSTETSDRIRLAQAGRAAVLARYDWRSVAEDLLRQWHRCGSRSSS